MTPYQLRLPSDLREAMRVRAQLHGMDLASYLRKIMRDDARRLPRRRRACL